MKLPDLSKQHPDNRDAILASDVCGCEFCLAVFAPGTINDWVTEESWLTGGMVQLARCPRCGAKSVTCSAHNWRRITPKLLRKRKQRRWLPPQFGMEAWQGARIPDDQRVRDLCEQLRDACRQWDRYWSVEDRTGLSDQCDGIVKTIDRTRAALRNVWPSFDDPILTSDPTYRTDLGPEY